MCAVSRSSARRGTPTAVSWAANSTCWSSATACSGKRTRNRRSSAKPNQPWNRIKRDLRYRPSQQASEARGHADRIQNELGGWNEIADQVAPCTLYRDWNHNFNCSNLLALPSVFGHCRMRVEFGQGGCVVGDLAHLLVDPADDDHLKNLKSRMARVLSELALKLTLRNDRLRRQITFLAEG